MLIAYGAPQHVKHHGALLVDDGLVMFPKPPSQVDGAVPVDVQRLRGVSFEHLEEPVRSDFPLDEHVRRVRRHGLRKPGVAVRLRNHRAAPPLVGQFVGQEAAEDMLYFRVHVGMQICVQAKGILEIQAPQHQHRGQRPAEYIVVRHLDDVELLVGIWTEDTAVKVEQGSGEADDALFPRINCARVFIHVKRHVDSAHGNRTSAVFRKCQTH